MANHLLKQFLLLAKAEGISFLILLFIAMPMKYIGGIVWPVKGVGWMHGVLFILYLIFLLMVSIQYKWSFLKILVAFLASLIPFGTFWLDNRIKKKGNAFI